MRVRLRRESGWWDTACWKTVEVSPVLEHDVPALEDATDVAAVTPAEALRPELAALQANDSSLDGSGAEAIQLAARKTITSFSSRFPSRSRSVSRSNRA